MHRKSRNVCVQFTLLILGGKQNQNFISIGHKQSTIFTASTVLLFGSQVKFPQTCAMCMCSTSSCVYFSPREHTKMCLKATIQNTMWKPIPPPSIYDIISNGIQTANYILTIYMPLVQMWYTQVKF